MENCSWDTLAIIITRSIFTFSMFLTGGVWFAFIVIDAGSIQLNRIAFMTFTLKRTIFVFTKSTSFMVTVMTSIFTFVDIMACFILIFLAVKQWSQKILSFSEFFNHPFFKAIYTVALKRTFSINTFSKRISTTIQLITFVQIYAVVSIPLK